MKSLVVFDSLFGNTETVARAVAEALGAFGESRAVRVAEIEPWHLQGIELLVVGSPTQKFRPTAATQGWLRGLPPGALDGVRVAAFDTRIDVDSVGNRLLSTLVGWFGYAAEPIEKRLLRVGGAHAGPPAGFIVEDKQGPLREGESARARAWALELASGPAAGGPAPPP
jgi:flavodoxin